MCRRTLLSPMAASGYGSVPTVTISGGSGVGRDRTCGSAQWIGNSIVLDNPGHGYQVGDVLTVTISGSAGAGATGHVTMTGFPVASLQVLILAFLPAHPAVLLRSAFPGAAAQERVAMPRLVALAVRGGIFRVFS